MACPKPVQRGQSSGMLPKSGQPELEDLATDGGLQPRLGLRLVEHEERVWEAVPVAPITHLCKQGGFKGGGGRRRPGQHEGAVLKKDQLRAKPGHHAQEAKLPHMKLGTRREGTGKKIYNWCWCAGVQPL